MTTFDAPAKDRYAAFWEQLVGELNEVFDAHGVCAAAASLIASHAGATSLVALSDATRDYYDVWLCDPGGRMEQARWDSAGSFFAPHLCGDGNVVAVERPPLPWPSQFDGLDAAGPALIAPLTCRLGHRDQTVDGAICLLGLSDAGAMSAGLLGPLAMQVTVFLERALFRQQIDQQAIEFGIVSDIGFSLTATLEPEAVFAQVADAVRRVLGAEAISIGLIDPTGQEIVFVSETMGPSLQAIGPIRIEVGRGVAGWVAQHGVHAIVNSAYHDDRFFAEVDRLSGFQTRSILCVPLKVEQRVIGILEVLNKVNGVFDEYDARLLQSMSGPLAVALENARLHSDVLAEKRRIEAVVDNMSEGVLTTDADGRIIVCNDALLSLLRSSGRRQREEKCWDLIDTRPVDFKTFWRSILDGSGELSQLACNLHQGHYEFVPVLISGAMIPEQDGRAAELIFVFSDLSQIREVERMRDDFFHNIVHELRTPLATILMYARLLREGKSIDMQKANRFLGVIEQESDRLQKMVRQMLELAKLETRELQRSVGPVNLHRVLDQVLPPLVDRAAQSGLIFQQELPAELPLVEGDHETLYMVLKNLVENAIKFSPAGTVRVKVWREPEHVLVAVSDEGIGIPAEALPNLFQRFYRTQLAVERGIAGTGLGLYMVKEALTRYNGSIEVASQEGAGTTFTVRLPIALRAPLEAAGWAEI